MNRFSANNSVVLNAAASFIGACSGAPMNGSYAWVAAGTATAVAHTKRSPRRLGESLT